MSPFDACTLKVGLFRTRFPLIEHATTNCRGGFAPGDGFASTAQSFPGRRWSVDDGQSAPPADPNRVTADSNAGWMPLRCHYNYDYYDHYK